ncbi:MULTISPECIES: hypothetical protein [Wolbachia]|uniref:hypothetical protein n=1 Tax=Wolbachia TaxID=953 RepID=UPI00024041B3|nr:hypothetical protein [Wolbachia pipientis]THA20263.1 hypothetical protein EJE47_01405 [Wolbachia endosymbiont of Aedes albopictus]QBB83350.1 hypothetical protein DEJ70_00350 [Wolbachia pipientis wAlbB]QDW08156.1 hypothetical protein CO539_000350 [Wolbachia pipientis]QDW09346.1 hypothetical protein CO538_000350 [Wolbachia pipientis]QZA83552.1 hypothetical protein K1Y75_00340 [Wolbachia pipientis]
MESVMKEVKIEERYHSLTIPGDMYHLQPEVIAARRANRIETFSKRHQMDYGSVLRGQDIQLKDVSSLEDASSEAAISPPSTPNHKKNRRGPGI